MWLMGLISIPHFVEIFPSVFVIKFDLGFDAALYLPAFRSKRTSFLKTCVIHGENRSQQKQKIRDFTLKCPVDFISNLQNEFSSPYTQWQLTSVTCAVQSHLSRPNINKDAVCDRRVITLDGACTSDPTNRHSRNSVFNFLTKSAGFLSVSFLCLLVCF